MKAKVLGILFMFKYVITLPVVKLDWLLFEKNVISDCVFVKVRVAVAKWLKEPWADGFDEELETAGLNY